MSYILEALNKEEAERHPEAAVALTEQLAVRRQSRLLRILGAVLAVTVVCNGLLFLWLLQPDASPSPEATGQPVPASPGVEAPGAVATPIAEPQQADRAPPTAAAGPGIAAATAPAGSPEQPPAAPVTGQAAARPVTAPDSSDPPAAAERRPAVPRAELPADVQARLPALEFSTHIYADDRDLRAVVLNGQRLQEGDRLDRLRLEQITEDGVVLGFEDYRVSVSVLEEWELP